MTTLVDFEPILAPIASEFARKFGRFGVEQDDLAQELRIWVFRHPNKIAQWQMDTDDDKAVDRLVARSLRNEALGFCQRAKADALGYSVNDLHYYSRGELAVLLDAIYDEEAWTSPPVSDDATRRRGDPATGGNWMALLADVSRAVSKLKPEERGVIELFHRDRWMNKMYAQSLGITEQAASARHMKALNKVLKQLGGERPRRTHEDPTCECEEYVGTRKVMSNAAARAAQENYYQEN